MSPLSKRHTVLLLSLTLLACGGGQDQGLGETGDPVGEGSAAETAGDDSAPTALDQQLTQLINANDLDADPLAGRSLPSISDPLSQLGMKLFFSKSLGGELDSACVSCHHPRLGGGDALSLPIGVGAIAPDLLGPGRSHSGAVPTVPRNAPTTFNAGLWDTALFHDGRVESLTATPAANGANGSIRTPDVAFDTADNNAGANLAAAQAAFPVTSAEEMRAGFLGGANNADLRDRLAARIGDYGDGNGELAANDWLPLFQAAYGIVDSAENLVTFTRIAEAIGEYERSQIFVNNPWRDYVQGDLDAISAAAKRGAVLFFSRPQDGGAGCSVCHSGPLLSDEDFHTIAFPMIGPGKGDGVNGTDDFGRERETGNANDRYAFRTPSLLNVALTAPYGRAGVYESLRQVVDHYDNQNREVDDFFDGGGWCQLGQFAELDPASCAALYPEAQANSNRALAKLQQDRNANRSRLPNINLNDGERNDLVAFLEALTDPCLTTASCLSAWIPARDSGPDGQQLNGEDGNGNPL